MGGPLHASCTSLCRFAVFNRRSGGAAVNDGSACAARSERAGTSLRLQPHDYHNRDDHERHAWGVYLSDNQPNEPEYSRANHKEPRDYWNWRHSHRD